MGDRFRRNTHYTLSAQAPEPFDGELVTPFLLEPPKGQPGAVA
jgi:hypothetical protein